MPNPNALRSLQSHFAESVAVSALSEDLAFGFSVRLARFPPKGTGNLWMSVDIGETHYAVADEGLDLTNRDRTPVGQIEAEFEVVGSSTARFVTQQRHTRSMHGVVEARSFAHIAHLGHDPKEGRGSVPMMVRVAFDVVHDPVHVRPGRMEVMGRVHGVVQVGDAEYPFDMPGKWHEQTGPRKGFAPAFTYLFVQRDDVGIMANRFVDSAWGYVLQNGVTTPVVGMEIDPYGTNPRHFSITLRDGRKIEATARIAREVSVPVEGHRRPGATVVVDGELGRMVGALNDWDPEGAYDHVRTPVEM